MAPASDQDFTYYAQFATEQLSDSLPYTAGASDGLDSSVPFSMDASDFRTKIPRRLQIAREWYRIVIINDSGVDQTYLRFQTSVGKFDVLTTKLNAEILIDADAIVNQSIISGLSPNGAYENAPQSGKYSAGSTSTPLVAGGEFIGSWFDSSGYANLNISIISDQAYDDTAYTDSFSVTGGILFEISEDGVTADYSFIVTPSSNPPFHFFKTKPFMQYMRIKYTNGAVDQTTFNLVILAEVTASPAPITTVGAAFTSNSLVNSDRAAVFGEDQDDSSLKILPLISAGTEITNATSTVITKSVIVVENSSGDYGRLGRIDKALKVYLDGIKSTVDVSQKPNTGLDTFQLNIDDTNAVQVTAPSAGRVSVPRELRIANNDSSVKIYYGYDSSVTATTGFIVFPETKEIIPIGDDTSGSKSAPDVWLISGSLTNTSATDTLDPDTVDSSTATNASNQYTSDDSRATYDADTETSTLSGFDATGEGVQSIITSIKIKVEMRKEPSAGNEVSSFVDVVGQDAGNTTSITSPTVTANSAHFYVIAISRRDEFANITQINSTMGFTEFTLIDDTLQSSSESRTSVYYAVGNPTGNGTITASFSQGADHSVISVTRFNNIDISDPIGNTVTYGANNSLGMYSNTVGDGVSNGQFYLAIGMEQGSHTSALNPSGATERFEDGSTAGNDQQQAIITANVSSGGAVSFNGTVTGTADITYVGVTLNPEPGMDPIVTISHSEGATTLAQTLSSETDDTYTVDITADSATWTVAQIDAMTVTLTASDIGVANAEVDHVYLDVTSSSSAVTVPVAWLGDAP